jgi:hypothetical protein
VQPMANHQHSSGLHSQMTMLGVTCKPPQQGGQHFMQSLGRTPQQGGQQFMQSHSRTPQQGGQKFMQSLGRMSQTSHWQEETSELCNLQQHTCQN